MVVETRSTRQTLPEDEVEKIIRVVAARVSPVMCDDDREDLHQELRIAALLAQRGFDPQAGTSVGTWVWAKVKYHALRYLRNCDASGRLRGTFAKGEVEGKGRWRWLTANALTATIPLDDRDEDGQGPIDYVHAPEPDPEEVALRAEFAREVREVLGRLKEIDREVLTLRYWGERVGDALAAELGINTRAAQMRLYNAHRRFRELYQTA